MKTIKDFTPEVQAKIPEYQARALKGVFNGGRYKAFDIEKAKKAVFFNYERAGYKKPVVLVAGNPYEGQVLFHHIKKNPDLIIAIYLLYCLQNNIQVEIKGVNANQLANQLDNQLDNQLANQLRNQLYNQLRNQLRNQLDNQLRNQLDNQLRNQLDNQLYNQLANQLYNQLRNQLDNQLRNQLYNQLANQLDNQLYNQLRNQLANQLRNQLANQLRNQLDNQLYNQLYNQLRNQLYNQLRNQLDKTEKMSYTNQYLFTLNVWSSAYFEWYKFMAHELKIEAKITPDLEIFSSLYEESNVYCAIFSELVCVVSKFPKKIYRDNDQRLHNPSGPAIEWEFINEQTNFENYYIHGRNLPEWIWDKKKITREKFLHAENEEIKAGMYEVLGQRKVMEMLGAKRVDKKVITHANGESEEVELYKTKEKFAEIDDQPFAWVKVICPSTGTNYLLGVEPHHTDAKEALASLSMFTEEEYSFDFRA